jgi:phosphate-selective porin OprO/OprP
MFADFRPLIAALALLCTGGLTAQEMQEEKRAEKQRLDISARLLLDGAYFDEFFSKDADDSNFDATIRNARLQLDYDFPAGWEGKLQIDATEDDVDSGSVYLRYTKWKPADITVGKLKEPMGLERNTSASSLMTVEGSMMSTAFTAGKNWGVHLYDANKQRRWALAATIDDNNFNSDSPYALTGRYTWSPLNDSHHALQLGLSGSLREWNDKVVQVRERAEVSTADNVVRSARFIGESQWLAGVEALWLRDNITLQAEYILTSVEEKGGPDWDYDGFYISGSYFLTGAQRRFSKGELKRVKPEAGGAWELVARYSELDVRNMGVGSLSTVSTVGVNYYYSKDIRVMLNGLYADISGDTRHDQTDGYATTLRLQFLF